MFGVYFVNKETKAIESAEVMIKEHIKNVNSSKSFIDKLIHRRLLFKILNYKNINKEVEVYLIDKNSKVSKFIPDSIDDYNSVYYSHTKNSLMNVDIDIYDIRMDTKDFDNFILMISGREIVIPEILESN